MTTSKIAKTKEAAVSTTCATRKRSFLKAYRKTGFIVKAAEAIGIHRNTVERWRERDPNFVAEFESAKKDYIETLEAETDRRAMGWEEDVFDRNGEKTGKRKKHSDLLMIFRLKGLAPEKYAERRQVDQRVSV